MTTLLNVTWQTVSFITSSAALADAVGGVFVFLGIGNDTLQTTHKLHTPHFKMDDSMMPVGAALHVSMALSYLEDKQTARIARPATMSLSCEKKEEL